MHISRQSSVASRQSLVGSRQSAGGDLRLGAVVMVIVAGALAIACHRSNPSVDHEGAAPAKEMSRAIVDPYLKIDAALSSDSTEGVTANAGEIATAATALGVFAVKIDTAAVQLTSAADLADARNKFGVLSEAIDSYMASQHLSPPEGVRVAFCPMVLKPWLQTDGPIRNPYYGSQMLTCGSFRN